MEDTNDLRQSILADITNESLCLVLEFSCCGRIALLTHRDLNGFDEHMTALELAEEYRCTKCGGTATLREVVWLKNLIETCPTCGETKLKAVYADYRITLRGAWALGVDDPRGVPLCQCG